MAPSNPIDVPPTSSPTAAPTEVEYQIGDRVERIENRDVTGATVVDISREGKETTLLLQYDEGGMGYWPASSVRLIERRPNNKKRRLRRESA
jgi:hypothetical protein